MPKGEIPEYQNLPVGKGYGPHSYVGVTSKGPGLKKRFCKYGCGCWVAGFDQGGGPVGLAPITGECPGNPLDRKKLGENLDWATVVARRIHRFLSMQKALNVSGFYLKQLLKFVKEEPERESKN